MTAVGRAAARQSPPAYACKLPSGETLFMWGCLDWITSNMSNAGKKGEHNRYLFHNHLKTECICNFCVMILHKEMMEIEFLRHSPNGTKQ